VGPLSHFPPESPTPLNLGTRKDWDRFWSKVAPEPGSGCWMWIAGKYNTGYGVFGMGGKNWLAHRLSFTWANGHISPGLVIDHQVCSNRACVRPDHLSAVSQMENAGRELRNKLRICLTDGCDRSTKSKTGLCNPCHRKQRRAEETRTCSIPGCEGRWHSQDLCGKHYSEARRTGTLVRRQSRTLKSQSIAKSFTRLDHDTGCWVWCGSVQNEYGRYYFTDDLGVLRSRAGHRAVWEEIRGPIPDGMVLDHTVCGNKLCCNPDHLEVVTLAENTARAMKSRRRSSRD
jgi:hypothetical protein